MKKLVCITAIAAFTLTGCSQNEEPAPEPMDTEAAEAETVATAPDGGPAYGMFEVTSADGATVIMQDIREDGTVTNTIEGTEPTEGTWTTDGDGNFCLTMAGETETTCYADTVTDGVWTATNIADETDSWTVVRMADEEAEAAPAT